MFIYNLSDKDYDDIVLKVNKSADLNNCIEVRQLYRKDTKLLKEETVTWCYSEYQSGYIIDSCQADSKDIIIIPKDINGKQVLAIGSYAFKDTNANKVVAPHRTKLVLLDYAFADMFYTKEIQLLAGADIQGTDVFRNSRCLIKFRR